MTLTIFVLTAWIQSIHKFEVDKIWPWYTPIWGVKIAPNVFLMGWFIIIGFTGVYHISFLDFSDRMGRNRIHIW
jgi:hypothetical protein